MSDRKDLKDLWSDGERSFCYRNYKFGEGTRTEVLTMPAHLLVNRTEANRMMRVEEFDLTGMLTKKAKKVYNIKKDSTVIEYEEHSIENHVVKNIRKFEYCSFFAKRRLLPNEAAVKATAKTIAKVINHLSDNEAIAHGFFYRAMAIPLVAPWFIGEGPIEYVVVFSTFPNFRMGDHKKSSKRLNELIGGSGFVNEGEIGNDDWLALEKLSPNEAKQCSLS